MTKPVSSGGNAHRSIGQGQKMIEPMARDNSSHALAREARKMGGSVTNLSHSLSGTKANQKGH